MTMDNIELGDNGLMDDIAEVLITTEELQARIAELGTQVSADYAGKDPLLVGVLRGVFVFMPDLVRAITIPIGVDFIGITRYGSTTQTRGAVRFTRSASRARTYSLLKISSTLASRYATSCVP